MIHSSGTSSAYVDLLSQLEESKFLRLFRYLAAEASDDRATGPFPVALPDAELQVMTVAGDRWTTAQNMFFQLGHLPVACWNTGSVETLLTGALSAAFTSLRDKPELINILAANAMACPAPESGWPAHWSGIDSFYLFVTNVCDPLLLSDDCKSYINIAHKLYETIVGVPRHSHPHFGIGNPEIFSEKTPGEVQRFMVALINDPSSYYLIAREGSITIVPVTEHGQYATMGPGLKLFATVTNALHRSRLSSDTLRQFEELLNSPSTKEKDIQQFLRLHPQILFSLDERYCELRPHVCLYEASSNRLIPDFMVRLEPDSSWDLIELKMPFDGIIIQSEDSDSPSAQAARGIAELLRYRDVLSTRSSRRVLGEKMGTAPYEPCLVMVIGRGDRDRKHAWRSATAGLPLVNIVSYDYLFQRAVDCQRLLEG